MIARGLGHSDTGQKRDQNEDAFVVDDALGLYVVSDGMGGHAAGEVASATAVGAARRVVKERRADVEAVRDGTQPGDLLSSVAREAVLEAARDVYDLATSSQGKSGMGCTLTVLLVADTQAAMGHVGDSRLYLCRDGAATQLSSDHTVAQELFRAGLKTAAEVRTHPYAHILSRAVGTQAAVEVDTLVFDVLAGDRLVLCTDGLSEYIEEPSWLARQVAGYSSDVLAEELVSYANQAGGKDNITVLTVCIDAMDGELAEADTVRERMRRKYDALDSGFMFEGLSLPMQARVLEACTESDHQAGELVVTQGDECAELFVVTAGRFELVRDGQPLADLQAGDYAGITTLLHPRPARASLQALEPGRLLRLDRSAFWKLVRRRPWLGVGLLERLGRRLSTSLDGVIEQRDGLSSPALPGERF